MTARSLTVGIALLAAAAAAAGLALLVLEGRRGAEETREAAGERRTRTDREKAPAPRAPASPAKAPAVPAEPGEQGSPPEGPSLPVRVLLGGVEPVPESPVMGAERDPDGGFLACFDEEGPESGKTDGEGLFVLRWPREPAERLIAVFLDRDAEVDRVEGAEAVGSLNGRHPVLRAGADPVVVHLRDREGVVRLRLLDDRTGLPLDPSAEPLLQYEEPGFAERAEVERAPLKHEAGGWWTPRPVGPSARDLRLRAAGYRDFALDPSDLEGRSTLRLAPSGTGVRGEIECDVKGYLRMESFLHRLDAGGDGDPAGVLGEIDSPGPFLLDGLDPGEWELEVRFATGPPASTARSWAVRGFAYAGKEIDLGVLRPEAGVSLRARWAPGVRDLPEGARLVLALTPFEGGGDFVGYQEVRSRMTLQAATIVAEGAPGEEGWNLFEGLRPGGEYLVLSPEVPGWRESVRAPLQAGESGVHEAGRGLRLTKCRLAFTVDGKKPDGQVFLQGPFRTREFDARYCVLESSLPPGRHSFFGRLLKTVQGPDGTPAFHLGNSLACEVEVPEGPSFEATVELLKAGER